MDDESADRTALNRNANEIMSGLYVGSAEACQPAANLGFKCISVFEIPWCKTGKACIHQRIISEGDAEKVDLSWMAQATAQIEEWVVTGESVLVHCRKGIERSPLTVAVWMRDYLGLSLDEAYALIAENRPEIEDRREWLIQEPGDNERAARVRLEREWESAPG